MMGRGMDGFDGVSLVGGFVTGGFLDVATGAAEFDDDLFAVDFFSVHLGASSGRVPDVVEFDEALVPFRRSFSQFLHRTWKRYQKTEISHVHAITKIDSLNTQNPQTSRGVSRVAHKLTETTRLQNSLKKK